MGGDQEARGEGLLGAREGMVKGAPVAQAPGGEMDDITAPDIDAM